METLKELVSTRFGIVLVAMYLVSTIAESKPDIAETAMYVIGCLAMAHVLSRTFGKKQPEVK